jgi:hypothetical protein
MQSEETIEIDRSIVASAERFGNGNLGPRCSVVPVSEGHDHRDAIGGAALENGNDSRVVFSVCSIRLREGGPHQK